LQSFINTREYMHVCDIEQRANGQCDGQTGHEQNVCLHALTKHISSKPYETSK